MDFFEEEVVRINEGLIKRIKSMKENKALIKNNKSLIIGILREIYKDNSEFNKYIRFPGVNDIYNDFSTFGILDTTVWTANKDACSEEMKSDIARLIKEKNKYYQNNKSDKYKVQFYDSTKTFSMRITIDKNCLK